MEEDRNIRKVSTNTFSSLDSSGIRLVKLQSGDTLPSDNGNGDLEREFYDGYGDLIYSPEEIEEELRQDKEARDELARVARNIEKQYAAKAEKLKKEKEIAEEQRAYKRHIANKKNNRKTRFWASVRITAFVIVLMMFLVIVLANGKYSNTVKTAYIQYGLIENIQNGTAYFLRTEETISAGADGKFIPDVTEGQRVATGQVIGYIVKPEYESFLKELKAVESKIIVAQNSILTGDVIISDSVSAIDSSINEALKGMAEMAYTGNLQEYARLSDSLDSMLKTKAQLQMDQGAGDNDYLNSLIEEQQWLMACLEGAMVKVCADCAGVVSFYVDELSPYQTSKVQVLDEYVSELKVGNKGQLSTNLIVNEDELVYQAGKTVTSKDRVARITPDIYYYISVEIGKINDITVNAGDTVSIRAGDGRYSVTGELVSIEKTEDKDFAIVRTTKGLSNSISVRSMNVDIVLNSKEGMKVPLSALAEIDKVGVTARITIVRNNYIKYVYVNILATDKDYAIINELSSFSEENDETIHVRVNDIYVTDHTKVTEGQVFV